MFLNTLHWNSSVLFMLQTTRRNLEKSSVNCIGLVQANWSTACFNSINFFRCTSYIFSELTNLLTTFSRFLPQKPKDPTLQTPRILRIPKLHYRVHKIRHLSVPWGRWTQSRSSKLIYLQSILLLPTVINMKHFCTKLKSVICFDHQTVTDVLFRTGQPCCTFIK